MKAKNNLLVRKEVPERDLKIALKNYKSIRMPEAKSKNPDEALMGARTLTEARKIMRGESIRRKS